MDSSSRNLKFKCFYNECSTTNVLLLYVFQMIAINLFSIKFREDPKFQISEEFEIYIATIMKKEFMDARIANEYLLVLKCLSNYHFLSYLPLYSVKNKVCHESRLRTALWNNIVLEVVIAFYEILCILMKNVFTKFSCINNLVPQEIKSIHKLALEK